jgi:hypothetical protein
MGYPAMTVGILAVAHGRLDIPYLLSAGFRDTLNLGGRFLLFRSIAA